MKDKAVSGMLLMLLFFSVLPFVFDVQPVEASGTIYIRADGTIDPYTVPIQRDGNLYTFTGNITSDTDCLRIERSNIVVDGAGYMLQFTGLYAEDFTGVYLFERNNVTLKNIVFEFPYGIHLNRSSNCIVSDNIFLAAVEAIRVEGGSGNNISNNVVGGPSSDYPCIVIGIGLWNSTNNVVSDNNLTQRCHIALNLEYAHNNCIAFNHMRNHFNPGPFYIFGSNSNLIVGNTISIGTYHIDFQQSHGNILYHNNFYPDYMNANTISIDAASINTVWDNDYPSGGNYWSSYTGVDNCNGPFQNRTGSDGIGDTPHPIDANNTDFYPLMSPYLSIHAISIECTKPKTALAEGYSTKLHFQVANAHFTETVNVTAYVNSTVVDSLTNVTVPSGNSTLTLTWNATSLAKGNYNLTLYATPVPGELFTKDNTYTYWVSITIVGDVDGDRDVDVGDQRKVQLAMFSVLGSPSWDPNADVDCDEDVDVGDQRKQQLHMFESW